MGKGIAAFTDEAFLLPFLDKSFDPDQPRDEHGRWTDGSEYSGFDAEFMKSEIAKNETEIIARINSWSDEEMTAQGVSDHPQTTKEWLLSISQSLAREKYEYDHFGVAPHALILQDKIQIAVMGVSQEQIDANRALEEKETVLRNGKEVTYREAVDKYVIDNNDTTIKMNAGLRAGRSSSENSALCQMTDWTTSQTTVRQPVLVSRESVLPESMHSQLVEGTTFTDKGFQSTQLGSDGSGYGAIRVRDGAQGDIVTQVIQLPVGQNVGMFQYGEIVLPRNTTVEVVRREVSEDGSVKLYTKVVK